VASGADTVATAQAEVEVEAEVEVGDSVDEVTGAEVEVELLVTCTGLTLAAKHCAQ
jgi:hypothetical protein